MKAPLIFINSFILVTSLSAQTNAIILEGWDTLKYPIKEVTYMQATKKIVTQGEYAGKNVFIRNPFATGGQGFCISQVNVNGNIVTDEINADVFQVDLTLHSLKIGDALKIEIFHKDCCTPMIMNPNAIKPKDNTMMIEGMFLAGSLFVVNPRVADSKAYSVKEVMVNGKKILSKIDSDVFEIDFYKLGIKMDEKVKVEFKYESGYDPFLMNPEILIK